MSAPTFQRRVAQRLNLCFDMFELGTEMMRREHPEADEEVAISRLAARPAGCRARRWRRPTGELAPPPQMNPLKEILRLVASELESAGYRWALI